MVIFCLVYCIAVSCLTHHAALCYLCFSFSSPPSLYSLTASLCALAMSSSFDVLHARLVHCHSPYSRLTPSFFSCTPPCSFHWYSIRSRFSLHFRLTRCHVFLVSDVVSKGDLFAHIEMRLCLLDHHFLSHSLNALTNFYMSPLSACPPLVHLSRKLS
ncbi:hypothetical protein CY34DRAFT_652329 [Suillus luteus UH-Slu-Lm8-n1]|uniref:Secreted protein n=1 Tax=Suillus luteus UH-Slu-Lm8-n1 TaxID=930992 RepID=A0A0C9Z9R1_9AGAM|nr:hypothetical protein CY34DRAFT_652329 [Suillus luteus UH-Slu-Lm8-n1]